MLKSRLSLALGLVLVAPLALAATPVGVWKGRIIVNMAKMPAGMDPQQKAMMQKVMAGFNKVLIVMTFKGDHTFSVKVDGAPAQQAKASSQSGTWSQKGNVVTTVSNDPRAKGHDSQMKFSADGRTLTAEAPNGQGKVVFTR